MAIIFPGEQIAPSKPDLENIESFDNSQIGGVEKFSSISTGVVYLSDVVAKAGDTMTGELDLNAGLKVTGGLLSISRAGVTDYTTADEAIVGVTNTGSARAVVLATADCAEGRVIIIKDESGAANTHNITVSTEGAEKIDGADTSVISAAYGVLRLYSNGSNWFTF